MLEAMRLGLEVSVPLRNLIRPPKTSVKLVTFRRAEKRVLSVTVFTVVALGEAKSPVFRTSSNSNKKMKN